MPKAFITLSEVRALRRPRTIGHWGDFNPVNLRQKRKVLLRWLCSCEMFQERWRTHDSPGLCFNLKRQRMGGNEFYRTWHGCRVGRPWKEKINNWHHFHSRGNWLSPMSTGGHSWLCNKSLSLAAVSRERLPRLSREASPHCYMDDFE